ncbi:MAG: hypothetical protein WCO78_04720 [Candidatus Roizmanbacteria bacterium]
MSPDHHTHKKSCPHCGNNPVNHTASYMLEFVQILTNPFYRVMTVIPAHTARKIVSVMYWPFIYITGVFGVWKYHYDKRKALSDRTRVIWDEAEKRGIEMEGIMIMGKPIEQYRAKINGSWHYFESLPIPPHLHHEKCAWIDDKNKLKKLMHDSGIPTAYGGLVTTYDQALHIFRSGKAPYIIKPRSGSRGRHTTTHIYSESDLRRAYDIGKQLSHFLMMEEHLIGSVYRGTYIAGEVVGILRGDPPRITGDSTSTIPELIDHKNRTKHPKVSSFVLTDHARNFLSRQGLSETTVLKKGHTIDLSEKIGLSYGGYAADVTEQTHPDIIKILKVAGDSTQSPVVGFDFIIPDVTTDPKDQRWGIIEANTLPFIDLHHFPLEGTPLNVAAKIWDLWNR